MQGTADALVRFLYIGTMLVIAATLMAVEVIVARTLRFWIDPHAVDVDLVGGFANLAALALALVVGSRCPRSGCGRCCCALPSRCLHGWCAVASGRAFRSEESLRCRAGNRGGHGSGERCSHRRRQPGRHEPARRRRVRPVVAQRSCLHR